MVRILYGVAGEGNGHYTRSKVVINYLSKKHKVLIAAGGDAYNNFYKDGKNVKELAGISSLHIYYKNNCASSLGTFILNLSNIHRHISSIIKMKRMFKSFRPQLVITDFEPFTTYFAILNRIPLISIENEHIITKSRIEFDKKFYLDYLTSKAVIKSLVPKADAWFLITFFYPEITGRNSFLFPPILRDEIKNMRPTKENHILVYQTSKSDKNLLPSLMKIKENFVVYGLNKNEKQKNIELKEFNEENFFRDLESCKAIIANGGFSLMTEALHLQKPFLSVPVRKQFEQIMNATYLDRIGYGMFREKISKEVIEEFISELNTYEKNLKGYKRTDNRLLFRKLDKTISELVPG